MGQAVIWLREFQAEGVFYQRLYNRSESWVFEEQQGGKHGWNREKEGPGNAGPYKAM